MYRRIMTLDIAEWKWRRVECLNPILGIKEVQPSMMKNMFQSPHPLPHPNIRLEMRSKLHDAYPSLSSSSFNEQQQQDQTNIHHPNPEAGDSPQEKILRQASITEFSFTQNTCYDSHSHSHISENESPILLIYSSTKKILLFAKAPPKGRTST